MLEPVAHKKIIEIIRDKDSYLDDINRRVKALMTYVQSDQATVDAIQELFLPKPMAHLGIPGGEGADYADLLEIFESRQIYHKNESKNLLIELRNEKDLIERVWGCYMSLPHYPHDLLKAYYHDRQIVEAMSADYDVSSRTIRRHRDMALKMVAERYASGIPLNTIFKLQQKHNDRINKSNNNIKVIFEMDKKEAHNE